MANASNTTASTNISSTTLNINDLSVLPDVPLPALVTWVSVASFLLTSVVGIVLYVHIFIVVIRKRNDKFKFAFYKFLLTLGVGEMLTSLYYGPFAGYCMWAGYVLGTSNYCPVPLAFNYVISSIGAWVVWFLEFTVHPLIALDRFFAIVFYAQHDVVFSPRASVFMCVGAWVAASAISAPIVIWRLPSAFYVWGMNAFFETSDDFGSLYNNVTSAITFVVIAFCCILYAACIVALVIRRHHRRRAGAAANGGANAVGAPNAGNQRAQRKLVIQGSLYFSLLLVINGMWLLITVANVTSVWIDYVTVMLLLLMPVISSIIMMCLNDGIREEIRLMYQRGSALAASGGGSKSHWAEKRRPKRTTLVNGANLAVAASAVP